MYDMNDGIFMRLFTIFQKFYKQLHKNEILLQIKVHNSSVYDFKSASFIGIHIAQNKFHYIKAFRNQYLFIPNPHHRTLLRNSINVVIKTS